MRMVSEKMKGYFEKISSPSTFFDKKQRPLLMLFNRKKDIQGMLYHSWKYLSLIQDIFGIKNNQFRYSEQNKSETFELDFANQ